MRDGGREGRRKRRREREEEEEERNKHLYQGPGAGGLKPHEGAKERGEEERESGQGHTSPSIVKVKCRWLLRQHVNEMQTSGTLGGGPLVTG